MALIDDIIARRRATGAPSFALPMSATGPGAAQANAGTRTPQPRNFVAPNNGDMGGRPNSGPIAPAPPMSYVAGEPTPTSAGTGVAPIGGPQIPDNGGQVVAPNPLNPRKQPLKQTDGIWDEGPMQEPPREGGPIGGPASPPPSAPGGITINVGGQGAAPAGATAAGQAGAPVSPALLATPAPVTSPRVPTSAEMALQPPGTVMQTPMGTATSGDPNLTLSPAGQAAYQSAMVRVRGKLAKLLPNDANAPEMEITPGRRVFDPIAGAWID